MPRPLPPKSDREEALAIVTELIKRNEPVPEEALELLRADSRITDFRSFIAAVMPDFQFLRYTDEIIRELELIAAGESQYLMVWMPPRHSKSLLISQLFPAYYVFKNPSKQVGIVSYSADLVADLGHATRNFFVSAGGEIDPDARQKIDWKTKKRGGVWARSVNGSVLGRGFSVGVCDDPHSSLSDINSATIRDKIRNFYDSVFVRRKNMFQGKSAIVIVLQRWSNDDLAGWLLSKSYGDPEQNIPPIPWRIIALDAIHSLEPYDVPDHCYLAPDWREEGEALAPEFKSVDEWKRDELTNPWFFASQCQQRPRSIEGQLCNSDDFRVLTPEESASLPVFSTLVRAWDIASSQGKGDFTVGALIGLTKENDLYILDIVRERLAGPDVRELIKRITSTERTGTVIAVEKAGVGLPIVQELLRDPGMQMYPLVPITIHSKSGDLRHRSLGLFGKIKAGQVYVKSAAWTPTLINEFVQLGSTKNDDIVSAVNLALTAASQQGFMGQQSEPEAYYHPGTIGWYRQQCGMSPDGIKKLTPSWLRRNR